MGGQIDHSKSVRMFGHYKDEVGSLKVVSTTCHSTAILAAYFAQCNRAAGDCFFLYGNVGAGKSHFWYAVIYVYMHVNEYVD